MIPSQKSRAFSWWFSRHAQRRIEDAFSSARVAGLEHAREALRAGPFVAVSNHTSWWDPLTVLWLTHRVLGADLYALMNAANLRRLPFFGLVGAVGVDREAPGDGALATAEAVRLLDAPRRVVWVFAQGDERAISLRPLGFRRGSAEVSRASQAPAVPFALRYEHGAEERPMLLVRVGAPIAPTHDAVALREAHEQAVTALLDRVDADLRAADLAAYETLHARGPSALGVLAEGCLSVMTRPFAKVPRR
ncbi:MAG: lysophospholipid acyltransferase family protein [Polyangiales bacterium]